MYAVEVFSKLGFNPNEYLPSAGSVKIYTEIANIRKHQLKGGIKVYERKFNGKWFTLRERQRRKFEDHFGRSFYGSEPSEIVVKRRHLARLEKTGEICGFNTFALRFIKTAYIPGAKTQGPEEGIAHNKGVIGHKGDERFIPTNIPVPDLPLKQICFSGILNGKPINTVGYICKETYYNIDENPVQFVCIDCDRGRVILNFIENFKCRPVPRKQNIKVGVEFTLVDEHDQDDMGCISEVIDLRIKACLNLVKASILDWYVSSSRVMKNWRIYRDPGCAEFSTPPVFNLEQLAEWYELIVHVGRTIGFKTENGDMNQGMHVNVDCRETARMNAVHSAINKFPAISWMFERYDTGKSRCLRGIPFANSPLTSCKDYDMNIRNGYIEFRAPKMPSKKADVGLICNFFRTLVYKARSKKFQALLDSKKWNSPEDIANYTLEKATDEFKLVCDALGLKFEDFKHLLKENMARRFEWNEVYKNSPETKELWKQEYDDFISVESYAVDCTVMLLC